MRNIKNLTVLIIAMSLKLLIIVSITLGIEYLIFEAPIKKNLDISVPIFANREREHLNYSRMLGNSEYEYLEKIYLTNNQKNRIFSEISKSWNNEKFNERLKKIINNNSLGLVKRLPDLKENMYWMFTNLNESIIDKRNIDEMGKNGYYKIAIGILDFNNNILYYYEYNN